MAATRRSGSCGIPSTLGGRALTGHPSAPPLRWLAVPIAKERPHDRGEPRLRAHRAVRRVPGGGERHEARRARRRGRARARRTQGDVGRGVRLPRRRGGVGGDHGREPGRVRAVAGLAARAARRGRARPLDRAPRTATGHAVPALAHRRRRARARRRRRGRGPRGIRPRRAVRAVEPGVAPDGGGRRGDGRRVAVVPALLERVARPQRVAAAACRGGRLRGRGRHPRHAPARLARPRPRRRLPAVHARAGHRAVHERPGVRRPRARAGVGRAAAGERGRG